MTPRRFPSLGLRDPAFLQGVGAPPCPTDPTDPNTHCWYRADTYVGASVIGDIMDTTVNKTSAVAPNFNLFPTGIFPFRLLPNVTDNDANLLMQSDNLLQPEWQASNFTKNTATTGTFTAQNGYIRNPCYLTDPGKTYYYAFRARAVSGNTNLYAYFSGSPTASTAVTLTNVLADYAIPFLGSNTGAIVWCGLQDQNAAGHGQIEQTRAWIYRSDHDGNYVATGAQPYWGKRNGLPTFGVMGNGPTTTGIWYQLAGRNQPLPMTIYATMYPRYWNPGNWMLTCNAPTLLSLIYACGSLPGNYSSQYTGVAPFTWRNGTKNFPNGEWHVHTMQWNGANSILRKDLDAAEVMNQPNFVYSANKWQYGGDTYAGTWQNAEFFEIIHRYTVDNTATQDAFIKYLGYQVGLIL